mmetsp:Transcript_3716/g.8872  ORF Transcript_3716/g.8872 Transcript_3716/m.8872 type:complete len:481 (+) Transcript_3716:130-1572(+)
MKLSRKQERWACFIVVFCLLARTFWLAPRLTLISDTNNSLELLSHQPPSKSKQIKNGGVVNPIPRYSAIEEISLSPECLKQIKMVEFQDFCRRRTHSKYRCQKLKLNKKITGTSKKNSTATEAPPCKTIWISGMSMGFETKHDLAGGGDGFAIQYATALRSYQDNAKDVLQAVLVLMTPRPMNSSSDAGNSLADRFTQWLESQGVIVIRIHELSFQDLVFRAYPDYAKNGGIAYYLRFDIPKLLLESHTYILDRKDICGSVQSKSNVVFYTDSDILFLQPTSYEDIQALRGQLTTERFLMYGQDFLIGRKKPSNTGVMFIHLEGFTNKWPLLLDFGSRMANEGNFPEHDQLWINHYFASPKRWKAQNLLLPPAWNWKVYWELEQKTVDGWDESSIRLLNEDKEPQVPIQLVHFHGPKPKNGANEIASCDRRAVQNVLTGGSNNRPFHPDYEKFVSHGMCCDGGKTAAWILKLYERWVSGS